MSQNDKNVAPTPRTDEVEVYYIDIITGREGGMYWVPAAFAQQLERELGGLAAMYRSACNLTEGAPASAARALFVCSSPHVRHAYDADPQGHCPECVKAGQGNWSCIAVTVQSLRPSAEWYRRKIAEVGDSEPAVIGAACAASSERATEPLPHRMRQAIDAILGAVNPASIIADRLNDAAQLLAETWDDYMRLLREKQDRLLDVSATRPQEQIGWMLAVEENGWMRVYGPQYRSRESAESDARLPRARGQKAEVWECFRIAEQGAK